MNKLNEPQLPRSARAVQDWLSERNYSPQVAELPDSTRSAADAASAIGCQIGQIVKSLVFKTKDTKNAVLILASGANQVSESKIFDFLGEEIEKADADFVRKVTGFSIGGIPPVGHTTSLNTIIDRDLLDFEEIWAAAGTPFTVFRHTPDLLLEITGGSVTSIS